MNIFGRLISVISLLYFPLLATAETSPVIRVVNMQSVIEESIAGKAARSTLEKELKEGQAELERGKLQLKKMQEDLQTQGMLLSKEALEKKREKLVESERDLRRKAQDLQEGMRRDTAKQIDKIVTEVQAIVAEIAREREIDFVLEDDQRFVVYAGEVIDISDEVVKILDEKKLDL